MKVAVLPALAPRGPDPRVTIYSPPSTRSGIIPRPQRGADCHQEIDGTEWFFDEPLCLIELCFRADAFGVSRHHQDFYSVSALPEVDDQLGAAHFRHHTIGKQKVDSARI